MVGQPIALRRLFLHQVPPFFHQILYPPRGFAIGRQTAQFVPMLQQQIHQQIRIPRVILGSRWIQCFAQIGRHRRRHRKQMQELVLAEHEHQRSLQTLTASQHTSQSSSERSETQFSAFALSKNCRTCQRELRGHGRIMIRGNPAQILVAHGMCPPVDQRNAGDPGAVLKSLIFLRENDIRRIRKNLDGEFAGRTRSELGSVFGYGLALIMFIICRCSRYVYTNMYLNTSG